VGTLYQYFPNKSALLRAALKRHIDEVTEAIERACQQQQGHSLEQMATALITAFLDAKMKDAKTSVALYALSSDVDGVKIVQEMGIKSNQALVGMLMTARERLTTDPQGVSRRLLESAAPEKHSKPIGRK
jgi:AcrR family transcriptional regulator